MKYLAICLLSAFIVALVYRIESGAKAYYKRLYEAREAKNEALKQYIKFLEREL